jgi:hypothetical protein
MVKIMVGHLGRLTPFLKTIMLKKGALPWEVNMGLGEDCCLAHAAIHLIKISTLLSSGIF